MAAVSILDAWSGQTAGRPNATTLTISSGTNRMLVLVYFVERGASFTFNSITCGGISPTGQLVEEAANTSQYIWSFYWDEAAIDSMSGTSCTLSRSASPTTEDWDYAVYQNVAGGAEYGTSVDESSVDTLDITAASTTTSNDFLIVFNNRESQNRTISDYDNLTQEWQYNDVYTISIADGAGGDDTVNMTGDPPFNGQWFAQILHLKAGGSALPLLGGASSTGGF